MSLLYRERSELIPEIFGICKVTGEIESNFFLLQLRLP